MPGAANPGFRAILYALHRGLQARHEPETRDFEKSRAVGRLYNILFSIFITIYHILEIHDKFYYLIFFVKKLTKTTIIIRLVILIIR